MSHSVEEYSVRDDSVEDHFVGVIYSIGGER